VKLKVKALPMHWLYVEAEDHLDMARLPGDRPGIAAILNAED